MTYFQKRRAEILGKRKRKPRACDVARQEGRRYQAAMTLRRQMYAARRLAQVVSLLSNTAHSVSTGFYLSSTEEV